MFFEARSDGELGMETVAKNVLTRLKNKHRGATTICGVVYSKAQYSYIWDDVPDVILKVELPLYNKVLSFAYQLYYLYESGQLPDDYLAVGHCDDGATHYHRFDITPSWAGARGTMSQYCGRFGSHVFYRGI